MEDRCMSRADYSCSKILFLKLFYYLTILIKCRYVLDNSGFDLSFHT